MMGKGRSTENSECHHRAVPLISTKSWHFPSWWIMDCPEALTQISRTFSEFIWFSLKKSSGQKLRKAHSRSCAHHRGLPISKQSIVTKGSRVRARWAKRRSKPKASGSPGPPTQPPPLLREVENGMPQVGLSTGVCADSPQIGSENSLLAKSGSGNLESATPGSIRKQSSEGIAPGIP
jgi:hypothetical protein